MEAANNIPENTVDAPPLKKKCLSVPDIPEIPDIQLTPASPNTDPLTTTTTTTQNPALGLDPSIDVPTRLEALKAIIKRSALLENAVNTTPVRMSKKQARIFLWAVPRSISTAFFRAMMNRNSVEVLLEPYSRAYYYGPGRVSKRYETEPIHEEYTKEHIKALCEKPYPEYDTVFVKDMAYYLVGHLDTPKYLPEGFVHTFILRNPKKSVYSLYKMSLNKELTGWDHFDAKEVGFKELYQMFELVTKQIGQEPIIVDADDLLAQPGEVLRLYCAKCGIEFEESMLNWDESPRNMTVFQDWMPWFEGVLTSKKFEPSATKPASPIVMPPVPQYVQKAIDENMYYYDKLYALRLKPNTLK